MEVTAAEGWTRVVLTIFWVIVGPWACRSLAKVKGYNPGLAAAWGFVGGIFAIAFYLMLPARRRA